MSRWKEFRREPVAGEWTRKQKRGYHRVRSLLWFWECHQFQVLWVTLSTAEGGDAEKLTYHHKQLRQRIERQLGFQGLEYYQVRTEEGHGVLHCQRSSNNPQVWSSNSPHLLTEGGE